MITRRRAGSLALVLGLGLGALPAVTPSGAAAADPLPCLPATGPLNFVTTPPLAPGLTSKVYFSLPETSYLMPPPPEQRAVYRADGAYHHEFTANWGTPEGDPGWSGTDSYPYTLRTVGTWIVEDSVGRSWRRFTVKAASNFVSVTGPGRVVTAGETITYTARLEGWTASGTRAPVYGMPVTVTAQAPNGATDPSTRVTTNRTGTISVPLRAVSNRRLSASSAKYGCYSHAGAAAAQLDVRVRKRITATPATATPVVGQYVKVSGTVYPARQHQPIYLQRWNGTSFETMTPGQTNGSYTFAYRPTTLGKHLLRVYTPYDNWHVSSASPNLHLTAR